MYSELTGEEKENQNDAANGPGEEQPKLMTLDEWKALQVIFFSLSVCLVVKMT